MWYIYILADPVTHEVRYVGKSVDPLWRLLTHLDNSLKCDTLHLYKWLRCLGCSPELRVIDQGSSEESWQDAERFYIKFFREEVGARLTNATDGGDGLMNYHHTDETRIKISYRTQDAMSILPEGDLSRRQKAGWTTEARARFSEVCRRKKLTPEHKSKIGAASKKMVRTETHKSNISAALSRYYQKKKQNSGAILAEPGDNKVGRRNDVTD